jgi:hypothetical protein
MLYLRRTSKNPSRLSRGQPGQVAQSPDPDSAKLERKIVMTDKQQNPANNEQAENRPLVDKSQIITTSDTPGVIILGILALILLVALLRSQARNRALVAQLSQQSR